MNWRGPLSILLMASVAAERNLHIVEPMPRNYVRDQRDGNNNNTLFGMIPPPGNNNDSGF
jgi:hypothetical protein